MGDPIAHGARSDYGNIFHDFIEVPYKGGKMGLIIQIL
jgi:hypothetical protein